jgi:hypothetical protein
VRDTLPFKSAVATARIATSKLKSSFMVLSLLYALIQFPDID